GGGSASPLPFVRGCKMTKTWNQTRVSQLLGIEYPIIQGPLGGLSSQRLTAAVSNFGGLGSFGAHGLEPNAIEDVIVEIRSLTAKPFASCGFRWKMREPAHRKLQHSTVLCRISRHTSRHSAHTTGICTVQADPV
ncbi:MAG TPA: nitronate monooxygenase, partial [Candidatus Acidoferrum sp.]|nr:nitronate monooxygenase [Candidatus Acidoferrum sp.]